MKVDAGARYPEDAEVNGIEENDDNPKMPFLSLIEEDAENIFGRPYKRKTWRWRFEIDVETGKIKDWPADVKAESYYKVCDDCKLEYFEDGKYICNNDGNWYVPDCLCLNDEGYGDYMDLTINADGTIEKWSVERVENWIERQTKK